MELTATLLAIAAFFMWTLCLLRTERTQHMLKNLKLLTLILSSASGTDEYMFSSGATSGHDLWMGMPELG